MTQKELKEWREMKQALSDFQRMYNDADERANLMAKKLAEANPTPQDVFDMQFRIEKLNESIAALDASNVRLRREVDKLQGDNATLRGLVEGLSRAKAAAPTQED